LDLAPLAEFKNLETLGLRTHVKASDKPAAKSQYTPFNDNVHHPQSIPDETAQHLLDMKSLKVIQFMDQDADSTFIPVEEWEATGTHGIVVRSLAHEGDSVLHTRTYSRSIIKKSSKTADTETTYTTSKHPQWEDAIHYKGELLSLRLISSMKRAQGSTEPWVGRGIEVGKKAWQVLLDYAKKHFESGKDAGSAEGSRRVKAEVRSGSEDEVNLTIASG
jgi:hypothetical protein